MYRLNDDRAKWHWAALFLVCSWLFYGCKEKYLPNVKDTNPNYLVVEGFINTGTDSIIFNLTRTFKLESKAVVAPERAAIITVESNTGLNVSLPELPFKPGYYGVPGQNLDQTAKYRLRIRTKDNKTYLSDFVESKIARPIDILKYDFKDNNLNIYTDTHDPSGKSVYYRYSYVETWEYTSIIRSILKVEDHQLKERDPYVPTDNIYYCWQNKPSNEIVLGATTGLTEDRLNDFRVIQIPSSSPKVQAGYSVLVKQNTLTKEAFEFWDILKKNTEQVDSIFDSQPSQLQGNIHAEGNESEVVVGYVSAGTTTQKRLMLSYFQLPAEWKAPPIDKTECDQYTRYFEFGSKDYLELILAPIKPTYLVFEYWFVERRGIIGVIANSRFICVDCKLQGGTNIKPSYWID